MSRKRKEIPKQDIGAALGLSRQRGYQLMAEEGFPEPVKMIGINDDRPIWDANQIVRWREKRKRKQ